MNKNLVRMSSFRATPNSVITDIYAPNSIALTVKLRVTVASILMFML